MAAWWAWVRHDARRRWRAAALLGVFVAVAGGVVLSTFIGGRREATAVDRLVARTHPATAMALPNQPGFDWTPVGELPYVRAMQTFPVAFYDLAGHPDSFTGFPPAAAPLGEPIERQIVLEGRLADHSRPDEVTISPRLRGAGVEVGDEVVLELVSPEVLAAFAAGSEPPDVPPTEVTVRVVGVAKGTFFGSDVEPTLAFYAKHRDQLTPPGLGYVNALVTLDGGVASIPRFEADLQRLAGRPVEVSDQSVFIERLRTATGLESGALLAFGLAAAATVLVLGGIAIARSTAATVSDARTLESLGFTRRQVVLAVAVQPGAALLAGSVGAACVAYAMSDLYPIGQGRLAEPAPGRHANMAMLAVGSSVLVLVGFGWSLVAASRQGRSPAADHDPSITGTYQPSGLPLPAAIGAGLAAGRRRGVGGSAVTAGLLCGVVGAVAALTFGAGLDRGATDGTLAGQEFDSLAVRVGSADLPSDLVDAWNGDERVETAARVVVTVAEIEGQSVPVFAVTDLKGRYDDRPLHGRAPTAVDEIALAPAEMRRLGVRVGDSVRLADDSTLAVVGEMFSPQASHTEYDHGARVVPERLAAIVAGGGPVKFDVLTLDTAPGVQADQLDEVWRGAEYYATEVVEAQSNLEPTRPLPRLLAAFIAGLAVAASGYALYATVRRRQREVAVLQVLGLTRRQAKATVAWHAAFATTIAVVAGVPVGFAIGRTLWQAVTESLPLKYVTPTVWLTTAAVAAGAAVAGAIVAAPPLRLTARDEPADLLRAE